MIEFLVLIAICLIIYLTIDMMVNRPIIFNQEPLELHDIVVLKSTALSLINRKSDNHNLNSLDLWIIYSISDEGIYKLANYEFNEIHYITNRKQIITYRKSNAINRNQQKEF